MSDIQVRGGAAGITAHCAQLNSLAARLGEAAEDLLASALRVHGYLLDPALQASAALDPIGYARAEADLLDAADAPGGLTHLGGQCALLDAELRAAAAGYEAVDRLSTGVRDEITGALGAVPAVTVGVRALARTHDPTVALGTALARDPQLADVIVDQPCVGDVLAMSALALPDGHAVVHSTGVDKGGAAALPPRRLRDVVGDLARRNADPRHGEIDVRVLVLPDGSRRAIVDVTGTKSWSPLPGPDITSLATNARALVGETSSYENGVLRAMQYAGVRPGDAVMLVGHSEGGMVAVTAARDALASRRFRVTHVITAGSPVGGTVSGLPRDVQVLALENSRDVVPHVDGIANPDLANVTTVTAVAGDGRTVLGDHGLRSAYVPVAAATDASPDHSLRAFLRSARGFLQARSVVTHTYQIQRR